MAVTRHQLTGDFDTIVGGDFGKSAKAWLTTNLAAGEALVDLAANKIQPGSIELTLTNGAFSQSLIATDSADTNIASGDLQYRVIFSYVDPYTRTRQTWDSDYFALTADADLSDIAGTIEAPLSWRSAFISDMEAIQAATEAARDDTITISGLTGEDAAVGALIEGTGGAGPITRAALSASTADSIEPGETNPQTAVDVRAAASFKTADAASRAPYIDAYNDFFGGSTGVFVTGQATAATTTTASVPGDGSTSVIPVTSAAGISAGVMLVTNPGTANQQVHRVLSVASNNVTVASPVTKAIANGGTVAPLWTNASHLSTDGWNAFAYFIANAKDSDGNYIVPAVAAGKRYTFLGNSWFANGGSVYATQIQARFPGAMVTNAGVSGNKSADMIARFAADVPSTSAVVIMNEPGVNDAYDSNVSRSTQMANMETLAAKARALGALPIFITPPPLVDHPTRASSTRAAFRGALANAVPKVGISGVLDVILYQTGTSSQALGVGAQQESTGARNTAFGYQAQLQQTSGTKNTAVGSIAQGGGIVTGLANTAVGNEAQYALTTGSTNTAVGDVAQRNVTTGGGNTAVGQAAQNALSSGNNNTSVGGNASLSLSTGSGNTHLGGSAGYAPGGTAANATTTASFQTFVGYQSGLGSTNQASYVLCLGYKATATTNGGFAIGTDSGGVGAASTAQNEGVLGTANHTVKVPGRFNVATRTPSASADTQGQVGDIAWDDSYLYAKTSAGWKRAALSTF